jgi:tRNA A37 methylthiotransferase MiaB
MSDQVPVRVARERNRVLRELIAVKKREFMESFVGREVEAITLTHYDGEFTEALTDNYLKLHMPGPHSANQRVSVLVEAVRQDSITGSLACQVAKVVSSEESCFVSGHDFQSCQTA